MITRTKLLRGLYFFLVTSGAPAFIGMAALHNAPAAIIEYAATIVLAILCSLVPGRIGQKRSFPLRFTLGMVSAFLCIAVSVLINTTETITIARTLFFGAVCSAFLLFALREIGAEYPMLVAQQGAVTGLVLYIIPTIILKFTEDDPFLQSYLWIAALVFLVFTAYFLNNINMLTGLATRINGKPPKSLKRGNIVITSIFALIAGIVIFWAQLREAAAQVALACYIAIMRFIFWFTSLFAGSSSSSGGENTGEASAGGFGFGDSETALFWVILEKVMLVVTVIVVIAAALFALFFLVKLLRKLIRRIRAFMDRYAKAASEDYIDEQVDLFDLDDLKEKTRARLAGVIKRFTQRTPKWEDMSVTERIRWCVRTLYTKAAADKKLNSLTIREAVSVLPHSNAVDDDAIADIYERARYSDLPPTELEAETLRKAVKP